MADPLTAVVERFVQSIREGSRPLELELRMGRQRDGRFVAAVESDEMDAVVRALIGASGADDSLQWVESHDYFYRVGDDIVRSSVAFDAATFRMHTRHVIKRRLDAADTARFRVSCASEQPVEPGKLPFATALQHMRIKQRRSVLVRPPELGCPLWCYDFTLVWGGSTKEQAELRQRAEPPTYEVEVEVQPEGVRAMLALLRSTGAGEQHVVDYLARRLTEIGAGLAVLG